MPIACRDPGSTCQGPTCKWGLHYLVPGSYVFASSFEELLNVFSLEEENASWNGQKMPFLKECMEKIERK